MEKKVNRNIATVRGSSTDSKKSQDGAIGKPWPRGGHRREPASNAFVKKSEPQRKVQPQRVKVVDKRPKPRGFYYSGTGSRNETTWLGEEEADLGSVFLPGSKKQSLNHLLNFSYLPRDGFHEERGLRKNDGRTFATRKHKYNKEHFLQANCQFVVNESGDYKQYMNNPDALVQWSLVEQVNVQVLESPSCPICLYPPVAAKMTRCGHIYCWSCILHYLALSDKSSSRCPICYDAVVKTDLKSVVAIPHQIFNTNETITFKLMKRPRGCLMAYPFDSDIKEDMLNMSENNGKNIYSKLLLADKENIFSIIERESTELEVQQADDENSPEKCFIEQAFMLLTERKSKVEETISSKSLSKGQPQLAQHFKNLTLSDEKHNDALDIEKPVLDKSEVINSNISSDELNIPMDKNKQSKFYYFYQAADGQHIYLHAINARMLEHTYGSLEFAPKVITGKILEKEGGSMTEDLRKRLRYLQHLPLTCQFEVAEIHLKQPIVSKETLNHFQEQIETRKKKRQRRTKEEKRREKRIEAEENRKMGKFNPVNLHLESPQQFPGFNFEPRLRSESENTQQSESSSSSHVLPTEFSSSLPGSSSFENTMCGVSFAAMLASEKKQLPEWPGLIPSATTTGSPKLINVTGAKMRMSSSNTNQSFVDSDQEPDDYEPVPDFKRSFGDALSQALERSVSAATIGECGQQPSQDTHQPGKKKKKKQKILFATNMAYLGH